MAKKELLVYRDTATEALDHLDEFIQKMNEFVIKHPNYEYTSSVSRDSKGWQIKVTIEDEK